jgi:hypothetical protein
MTVELRLDEGDAQALRHILETYLGDLSSEIADADSAGSKAGLRH